MAADEARRLGERDDDAHLPSDPTLTHDQAVVNLLAGLPGSQAYTRHRTDDGRWVDPRTGIVSDTFDG